MLDLLKGTRVVSFNHFLLGPMGIQALGDLGADVISVETPEGAWQRHWSGGDIWHDGQSALHLCANRNKRSVAIDLKAAQGRELALRLTDAADVVAENFRPGVMEKLGLGYEALKARKPGLIYASASGYGPDGPYAGRPGQDLLAQALFGLMAITGQAATGPRPAGVSVVDHHGAALFAMGILAAIVRRQRTGQGCRVDASLMQRRSTCRPNPWSPGPTRRCGRTPPTPSGMWRPGTMRRPTGSTPPRTAIWRCRWRPSNWWARPWTSPGSAGSATRTPGAGRTRSPS
jgi:crotonobetainyl-CoA:carnitine CoA-transferase CaiB-like acyl-CoA transferase